VTRAGRGTIAASILRVAHDERASEGYCPSSTSAVVHGHLADRRLSAGTDDLSSSRQVTRAEALPLLWQAGISTGAALTPARDEQQKRRSARPRCIQYVGTTSTARELSVGPS
jgi:hypothetical protein